MTDPYEVLENMGPDEPEPQTKPAMPPEVVAYRSLLLQHRDEAKRKGLRSDNRDRDVWAGQWGAYLHAIKMLDDQFEQPRQNSDKRPLWVKRAHWIFELLSTMGLSRFDKNADPWPRG